MTARLPALDVLLPDDPAVGLRRIEPDDAEAELRLFYAAPPGTDRPWLRANMISTVDGAVTGPDGRSGSINGPADLRVFTVLRALADVVLVGAGTVRAEGYRAPRTPASLVEQRRGRGVPEHPALAIVTRDGDIPVEVLTDRPAPYVFTTTRATHLTRLRSALPAERLLLADGDGTDVDLTHVVQTLVAAGLRSILTEGGPRLLAGLVAHDLLDELCLTTSPMVVAGRSPRILDDVSWLAPVRRVRLTHLLHADGVLLGRWQLPRR